MSDYLTKLESFPDLEVSIIRTTKINKVLKAILKLEAIPKEEDYKFKARSQALLDIWNKILLASEATTAAPGTTGAASTNGVNGTSGEAAGAKQTNGVEAGAAVTSTENESAASTKEAPAKPEVEKLAAVPEVRLRYFPNI